MPHFEVASGKVCSVSLERSLFRGTEFRRCGTTKPFRLSLGIGSQRGVTDLDTGR